MRNKVTQFWNLRTMFPIRCALTRSGMNDIAFPYKTIPHAATHCTTNIFTYSVPVQIIVKLMLGNCSFKMLFYLLNFTYNGDHKTIFFLFFFSLITHLLCLVQVWRTWVSSISTAITDATFMIDIYPFGASGSLKCNFYRSSVCYQLSV